jgi:lipopolysaccharide export system permease protein
VNPRRASNWNLVFALLAYVVYFNLINLTQSWVSGRRLGLEVALLWLHGSALAAACGLIWWRDHASGWSWARLGRRWAGQAPATRA